MAEKRITIPCPQCGTYAEIERGFFGWKSTPCPSCRTKITINAASQVVECSNCHKSVVYDAVRKNDCPVCHASLRRDSERMAVGCPKCSTPVYFYLGETEATCLSCGEVFDPKREEHKQEAIVTNDAPDIKMSGLLAEDEFFWKHPAERHPLNARVVAKGGMYAVCIQGSTPAFVVDGQSVKLSESTLCNDAHVYGGGANPLVDAEIYFVRSSFSAKFRWGGASSMTDRYNVTTNFAYSGFAEIDRITDPAAFLRFIEFNANARVQDFRMQRDGGVEKPGRLAETMRDRVRSVCQGALANVRDRLNLSGDQMLDHKAEIFAEIQREANAALAEWGISVRNVTGEFNKAGTVIRQDLLEKRLAGAMSWKLPSPVVVHLPDAPHATAQLQITGSLYVTVHDVDRLNQCKEAPRWRDESSSETFARDEVTRYVGDALLGRFSADLQQLIDDLCPPLHMLQSHTGYLASQAMRMLNEPGGYFHSRGMSAGEMSMVISVGAKSSAFEAREKAVTYEDELAIRERMEDLTRGYEMRKDNADTDQTINKINNASRVEDARASVAHQQEMRDLRNAAEADALRRSINFDAWRDQQKLDEAREEAEYARARRAQLQKQEGETARALHERDLFAIAQQIEQSKLDWREKLDAYARLQRGMAFRDAMDERQVTADVEAREKRLQMQLRAEDRQVMDALDHEEALREEEIAKIRFARQMELRHQQMAEEAARLQAEFDRERAQAAEHETRMKAREEVETLKLMLECLTAQGAQQVTAEHLRNARAQAERTWREKHAETENKAAETRRQEQISAEKAMADRAMALTQQLLDMQKELTGKQIDATAKGAQSLDMNTVIDSLSRLCQNVAAGTARPIENPLAGMDKWLDSIIAKMNSIAPQQPAGNPYGYTPYGSSPYNAPAAERTCGRCGKSFSANAYVCPHCGWHP